MKKHKAKKEIKKRKKKKFIQLFKNPIVKPELIDGGNIDIPVPVLRDGSVICGDKIF